MLLTIFLFLDLFLKVISLLQQKNIWRQRCCSWRPCLALKMTCVQPLHLFLLCYRTETPGKRTFLSYRDFFTFILLATLTAQPLALLLFFMSVLVCVRVCEIERAHHNFLPREPWPAKLSAVLSTAPIFVQPALACAPCCTPNIAHGRESPAWSFKATPGAQALFCSPVTLSIFLLWCKAAFWSGCKIPLNKDLFKLPV